MQEIDSNIIALSDNILHTLTKSLKKGSSKSFEKIYALYSDKLYGFGLKLLGSEELSRELVQEVFIRLWERRSFIDPDKSLSSYLYTIAHNLIKDYQKAYAREYQLSQMEVCESSLNHSHVFEQLAFKEMKAIEASVVNQLPSQQKEVYRLSRYEHHSYQEIAEMMGISVNSVKTHLRLALKTLRVHLEPLSDTLIILMITLLY